MKVLYLLVLLLFFTNCEHRLFEENNNDPITVFDSFWHELDRNYSFFTYSTLNWDSIYAVYRPKIDVNTSQNKLFQILTNITNQLNDAHTNLYTPLGVTGNINYFNKYPLNQITLDNSYFDLLRTTRIFEYSTLKSTNLGYIKIKTFDGDSKYFEEIDTLLDALKNTAGLIIDVRSNRGGEITNSEIVASRLADSTRITCKYRIRNGPQHTDFSNWINISISPDKTGIHYRKPVTVLTNRQSFSATEWFVLFTEVLPSVTIVGDTTGGGSAIPLVRELSNGWILRTSNTQTMTLDGRDFQFTGLYPDVPIWIAPGDSLGGIDTILEKAVAILEK